jgi:hypothetical protein
MGNAFGNNFLNKAKVMLKISSFGGGTTVQEGCAGKSRFMMCMKSLSSRQKIQKQQSAS